MKTSIWNNTSETIKTVLFVLSFLIVFGALVAFCDYQSVKTNINVSGKIKISNNNLADDNCEKLCQQGKSDYNCREWRERTGRICN